MNAVIIDYGAGNIRSLQFALENIGVNAELTGEPEIIKSASHVFFPGVGQAGFAMEQLRRRGLNQIIVDLQQPVLGICLGMQLMCATTEEGNTAGLAIFNEQVKLFDTALPVPHMGWNSVFSAVDNKLFKGIPSGTDFYFVHSYCAEIGENRLAQTNYDTDFASAMQRDNFWGVQFHPEKSAEPGLKLLTNFISL